MIPIGNWWRPKNRRERAHFVKSLALAFILVSISGMSAAASSILRKIEYRSIAGWDTDDHSAARQAFLRSCREIRQGGRAFGRLVKFGGERHQWISVCESLEGVSNPRAYFEGNFTPLIVSDPQRPNGLFTGYYEPEALGSRTKTVEFSVPIYRKPDDLVAFHPVQQKESGLNYGRLVGGRPIPYHTRREIEQGAIGGRGLEIVWLKDWADAFFIHIQGSGRVRLQDGSLVRLAYAAKSGQPYTGIGGVLADRGVFTRDEMSMQATRKWMSENPKAARELMWENKSFIFFREVEIVEPDLGPPGAQNVALTPGRSLAVDRSIWMFGTPIWLDTLTPSGPAGSNEPFRRLMIAQDTGTAIRGYVRGDIFWGAGEKAERTAGHLKSPGKMIVLLPNALAEQLLDVQ